MKKLHEVLADAPEDIEVPWYVWRLLGPQFKVISIAGHQASFGEDYGTLNELRLAIEWYADQLGMEVKIKKEKK